jgi:DNA-binding transcriptional ArsR family regulator
VSTGQPGPTDPGPDDVDIVVVETDEQLQAVGNLVRQRIVRVLREGPASVTQVARNLGITKGNAGYHMKVLAEAGLVRVVGTRKVRGVTEIYYGPVGNLIVLPDPAPGQPDHLMRSALAEVEAMPAGMPADMRLKFLRLSPADFDAAAALLRAAFDQICAMHDPLQPAAALFTVVFRPRDLAGAPSVSTAVEQGALDDNAARP